MVLNVTPDHLDRHYTLERYAAAKARALRKSAAGDFAVLNADDPITRGMAGAETGPSWFSSTHAGLAGSLIERERIVLDGEPLMETREVPLARRSQSGKHHGRSASIARLCGATHAQIRAAVMSFPGVEHRLEFVREFNGVAWYNDSKATNVDATLKAIAAFPGGLWVILGGKDKDCRLSAAGRASPGKRRTPRC